MDGTVHADRVVVTVGRAAALTGLTRRQLDHWARTDRAKPSYSLDRGATQRVSLYRLDDLAALSGTGVEVLRERVAAVLARDPASAGRVEQRRGARGSRPYFAGTRIPVEAVQRFLAHGATDDDVLTAYPALTTRDVEAARSLHERG